MGKIVVVGIGPGSCEDITAAAKQAISSCDVVIGYNYYFQFIEEWLSPSTRCVDTGMRQEEQRAQEAFKLAEQGESVVVISSGDANIYGMSPLIWEMKQRTGSSVEVEVIPAVSAFQKAASLLGAPIGHDFCVISLSDLMTPWERIEQRIKGAAMADFVTAIYNPKSVGRYWQLHRLKELFLECRDGATPVGYVRQAGRDEQVVATTTLAEFNPEEIDMFTVVIIGNSQSQLLDENKILTPRGYYRDIEPKEMTIGAKIMNKSFSTIESELKDRDIPLGRKWALLHAIHTTADFEMEQILHVDEGAVESLHQKFISGEIKSIITDVSMVVAGVRKAALERLGVEVKCLLYDERVAQMAQQHGITRTQAGIRLAAAEYPNALYVFGNAPTALIELCTLMRRGKATPGGVIASPVGFVNVEESKYMVKSFEATPKIVVEGRKGGSNLAATLVNAILTFDDAQAMQPGRDL
ncbi:MAG: precorrin-3B C(17)-methyltransferase [Rikenellaceae bacterium]